MKAIIYYRKSTDRDDKQANSLEHQLNNCKKTAQANGFKVIEEIWESKSAKTEWTRSGFNRLLQICKRWKIDYIVIDEAKRLSRNNLDSARIIDLFDKWLIKWIYSSGRQYLAENINDIFLLQLDLSLSKMDNAHRSKEVKEKMRTSMQREWRYLGRVPFWYRYITLSKKEKKIIIEPKEAEIVKAIFYLRIENKAFTSIERAIKEKYSKKVKFNYSANRLHRLISMKFYYWVFTWEGKEAIGTHEPIISKDIYDKANIVWKWVHEKTETITNKPREYRTYHLKWLLKDPTWMKLTSYTKKWIKYYSSQYRSTERISINEALLFEKIWNVIKSFDVRNINLENLNKDIILNLIQQEQKNHWNNLVNIERQIHKLRDKQDKLLDLKLDDTINGETYLHKNNNIENEITELLEEKDKIKNDDFDKKTQFMLELTWSLYLSYFRADFEWKKYIIKNLMLELFIDNKKELQIAESPLLKSSKMLKILNGTPKDFNIRTFLKILSKIDIDQLKEFHQFIRKLLW